MTDTYTETMMNTSPIGRPHYAASVTGNTDDEIWKRLMRQWYRLKPVRGHNWYYWATCPHRLVKQRCSPSADYCRWVQDGDWNRLPWDHARAWRDTDGNLVITLEPYGNPFDIAEEFHELERELGDLGITICFEGRSPYGASYILFLMAADTELGSRAKHIGRISKSLARHHFSKRTTS